MSLISEVVRVTDYIKETKTPTPIAIRELWPELIFSDDEATQLQQEGFAALINPLLTSVRKMDSVRQSVSIPYSSHEAQPAMDRCIPVNIEVPKVEPRLLDVTVLRVLAETMYDIRGSERKAVADFEVDDCSYVIERNKAAIQGQERHQAVFEYVRKQLETSGAERVRELPEDEQYRISRMLNRVKKGEEPFGPSGPVGGPVGGPIGPSSASQGPRSSRFGAA